METEHSPPSIHDLLRPVADCLALLLEPGDFSTAIPKALARIGQAAGVDRVYVFENHGPPEDLHCSQRFEWVRDGVSPQILNPDLLNLSFLRDIGDIFPALSQGRVFTALSRELGEPMRSSLRSQNIHSIALVPIFVQARFSGLVGFDDCRTERVWEAAELDALRAVAAGIGSALVREQTERSMLQRAEELTRSRRAALSLMEDAQRAVKSAEEANRAKSAFLAMMSHEIRTPLNGVIGFTDLLQGENLTPPQLDLVSTIRSCGDSLLALISDILDLSRIESGRLELESLPMSPAGCLRDVAASFEPVVHQKNLSLRLEIAPSLPEQVLADPKRLRQIFFNLIGNAVKFTSEGSVVVTLESRIGADGRLELAGSVSDSGIGMNEEEVRTIFEAFAQAHAAIHRKYGGSGLGLAICQNLLQAMGGTISVKSTPGVGSTFSFTLPVYAVTTKATPALPSRAASSPGALEPGLRILVVDDVPNNVRLTIAILRRLGYAAEAASDGHEAIRLATASAYDVIFMDVLMPDCDGLEATREIRRAEAADPHRKPARIIALTADAFAENRTRCLAAGMDDFVTKPLRIDALRQALLRVGRRPVHGT